MRSPSLWFMMIFVLMVPEKLRADDTGINERITALKAETAAIEARHAAPPRANNSDILHDAMLRSRGLSSAMRAQADKMLGAGKLFWKTGDYAHTELILAQLLALDPANAEANYLYADCLLRRGSLSAAAEFMHHAEVFGLDSAIGREARHALEQVPPAPPMPPAVVKMLGSQPRLTLRAHVPQLAEPGADAAPVIWTIPGAISTLQDCSHCPALRVIPAGSFTMGAPVTDPDRDASEGPQHRVTIAVPFALGTYPVTVAEYGWFAQATHRPDPPGCWAKGGNGPDGLAYMPNLSWHNPGFAQSPNSPAVCVNWDDATAYAAWLSRQTGHQYHLPSAAEFEYADRAGTVSSYWWGNIMRPQFLNCVSCAAGNLNLPANAFGLIGMNGVVWQMTSDCYHDNYAGAPTDGSAWITGSCNQRVVKGGSFINTANELRSATNFRIMTPAPNLEHSFLGFRVEREL